jgi:hypothetical protein
LERVRFKVIRVAVYRSEIHNILEPVIMKFVTGDRRVATGAALAILCSVLASLAAQSPPYPPDSLGTLEEQARKLATQTKTITGCLQRGYEQDEF